MGDTEDLTAGRAVAEGGPVDGTDLGPALPDAYEVVMADGSRHRYVRSTESRVVYRWTGRV